MASFTDQIMQFKPYVSQLPVDAMVKVGMYKQQKYDEGVQKIQAYIDNIAGLDIAHDSDKAYLQSKLNELGSRLKTVAAGDFSNAQLVTSVGGMVKQVSKDENIQNAVGSTSWYRKQNNLMEEAIRTGKASQANIYDYQQKVSGWLNKQEVGQKFNGRYTQAIDVRKKALEAIKALHPSIDKYDIPFEVSSDGKINTKKIADAMQRYKIEGIDEEDIQQAIAATFSPDDYNQIRIDGNYEFRNVTPEQLERRADANYRASMRDAAESVEVLRRKRNLMTNPDDIDKANKRIGYYERLLGIDGKGVGQLDEILKSDIETIRTNPDAAKYSIYKDAFTKEFANAFSWKNTEMEYVKSPLRDQLNWVMDYNQKSYQFEEDKKLKLIDIDIKKEANRLKAQENALKNAELYGIDTPWTPMLNETDTKNQARSLFRNHLNSVSDDITSSNNKLLKKYTQPEIDEMLADFEKNGVNGSKVKPDAIGSLQEMLRNKNYLASLEEYEKRLSAESQAEANVNKAISEAAKGKPGIDIVIGGKRFILSPEEVLKIRASTSTKASAIGGFNPRQTIDRSKLNNNQIAFLDAVNKSKGTAESSKVASYYNSIFNQYGSDVVGMVKGAYEKAEQVYLSKLAPNVGEFVPQWKAITTSKDKLEPPSQVVKNVSALISRADIGSFAADAKFNVATASSYLKDDNLKNTRVFIEQSGDRYIVHLKNEEDPTNIQSLKLTQNEIVKYFGNEYSNPRTKESMRLGIGRGSTNVTGEPTRAFMQKQFGDFPAVTKMQVVADLDQDLDNPDLYIPKISVMKKDGTYATFQLSGFNKQQRVGFEQGRQNLNNLTDDLLLKSIKQEYPNYDYSQLLIK